MISLNLSQFEKIHLVIGRFEGFSDDWIFQLGDINFPANRNVDLRPGYQVLSVRVGTKHYLILQKFLRSTHYVIKSIMRIRLRMELSCLVLLVECVRDLIQCRPEGEIDRSK